MADLLNKLLEIVSNYLPPAVMDFIKKLVSLFWSFLAKFRSVRPQPEEA